MEGKSSRIKGIWNGRNQFIIPDIDNSALRTFFNVSSIPHYAILDSNNDVYLINAPSPRNTFAV